MVETALIAFTTLFATVGPVDVATLFAALTARASVAHRRQMAIKGTLIAGSILIALGGFGHEALRWLGITLPALRIAGGILLLLMAIDMVFARHSGGISTTADEAKEASHKADISVFPLATPLIAGPGAMGAVILLMSQANGDLIREGLILAALLAVLAITLALLLIASQVSRFLGVTGQNVITRVVGVLLAGLAVQFLIDGIRATGLVG